MKKTIVTFILALLALPVFAAVKNYALTSPDGVLSVQITVDGGLSYSLYRGSTQLLKDCRIGMAMTDGTVFGNGDKVTKVLRRSVSEKQVPIVYKKAEVKDEYNEITLRFKEFDLVFRAYDDGVAYHFTNKLEGERLVASEQADFSFPASWNAYIPYVHEFDENDFSRQYMNSFESFYIYSPISEWDKRRLAFLPLLVEEPSGLRICITESNLTDYPGMYLYNGDGGSTLTADFAPYPKEVVQGGHNMIQGMVLSREDYMAKVDKSTPLPWRIVVVTDNDAALAGNDLVWLLGAPADPSVDYSWVRPGKVAWDWWNDWNIYGVDFKAGINNDTYKYYIDFASRYGIEYVILDEGWSVGRKADLFQVIPEIDLPMLVEYGRQKGVGLILWAGYWAFNRDMDAVCRHYSRMGIKGFKIDFMNRDDQPMVQFFRDAAATAAKYGLVLDFHGAFKPAGLLRTYPNVLNVEGVYGLEQMKWGAYDPVSGDYDQVTYDTVLPFIRMVAGPCDYTQGAMRNAAMRSYRPIGSEPMSQGTRCRQLAEYIIFDSPLNMLCDSPSNYYREPECTRFIADCPTVWDETVPLEGKIGQYVAIARRRGDKWYVGAITGWKDMDLTLDMGPVLGEGDWKMDVFKDGINADKAARDFRHDADVSVPADGKVSFHMASGGGWAAVFSK